MNKCKECSVDIAESRKFCSSSCSATHNNKLYPKRTNGREKPKCKNCDIQLNTYQKEYCNNKCQQEYIYKTISIPKILAGEFISIATQKRYLKETKGANCTECGNGEVWNDKPITLQLDHIDGNSDNNELNNLRLVCPNCHTQTETYGSKGVGSRYKKDNKRNQYLRKYKGY
jgi:hypothetical protein|tara:strand:+ start:107 stop:622 length:516 start_codon:yes stop_codon:yes gene_type:complete